ncbi:MAG: zinc-dependent peptidase [Agriterribacter sp.]
MPGERIRTKKAHPLSIATNFVTDDVTQPPLLVYSGDELDFSDEVLFTVLNKHLPYFSTLSEYKRNAFLYRLRIFISLKTFVIHDKSGFREMPILLSATAIKLSMGLEKFELPHYTSIHIFPAEFIGVHPTLRVLSGNVSGNSIHISWKHFLEGYKLPDDGQNVGLHEMAHAYYYQNFETDDEADDYFVSQFKRFNTIGKEIFEQEKNNTTPFYSSYALTNFQEFWAESVELFFEKPERFKNGYPALYAVMVKVLNQNPLEKTPNYG